MSIITGLQETHRQVIQIVLDLAGERGEPYLIPMLEEWKSVGVKKVRGHIDRVIHEINRRSFVGNMPGAE